MSMFQVYNSKTHLSYLSFGYVYCSYLQDTTYEQLRWIWRQHFFPQNLSPPTRLCNDKIKKKKYKIRINLYMGDDLQTAFQKIIFLK
jgi:hypothetical protein